RLTQWRQDLYGGPRLVMWRDTVTLIGRHAVLGTGPESFGTQFRRVESAGLSRAYPDFSQESPHNLFLSAAVEQGMPGLVVMVVVGAAGAYLRQDLEYRELGRGSLDERIAAWNTVAGMRFPGAGDDMWASRQFAAYARSSTGESATRAWAASAEASTRAER